MSYKLLNTETAKKCAAHFAAAACRRAGYQKIDILFYATRVEAVADSYFQLGGSLRAVL